MKTIRRERVLIGIVFLFAMTSLALAAKPTWSKKAVSFPEQCTSADAFGLCQPVRIPSPDGKSSVEVRYQKYVLAGC